MDQISFQYSPWYLLLFLVIASGISYLVYSKKAAFSDKSPLQLTLLAALRAFAIFLLLVLLLNPILKSLTEYSNRPILVFAQDGSRSVTHKLKNDLSAYLSARDQMLDELKENFDVQTLDLSDKIHTVKRDSFDGHSSDLNSLFEYCSDHLDVSNVKAIVLASDGIYNQGKNPLYNSILKQIPVYTILQGDTTQSKDLSIVNIFHNEIIHAGDEFIAQIDLKAFNCNPTKTQITLKEYKNDTWQTLQVQPIDISDLNYFQTFDFRLSTNLAGIYRYKAELGIVSGESNSLNNTREFYVQVLDSKIKILILANSPHPDISAIRSALQANKNYQVELSFISDLKFNTDKVQAIILHQIPSFLANSGRIQNLLSNKNIPLLYVLGESTQISEFNKLQSEIRIQAATKGINEALPVINNDFKSFTLSPDILDHVEKFPPLNAPFGTYEQQSSVSTLLYQKIGRVETKFPLWALSDQNGIRSAFIFGDGIWKWRLSEFNSTGLTSATDEIISQTLQFITTKNDDRRLRVKPAKNIFASGEHLRFNAEFYNDNFTRINDADLHFELIDFNKNKYPFVFSKELDFYTLNCGSFPPGEYRYQAKISWNQKEYQQEGRFAISGFELETANTTADHALLRNIALNSAGKSYSIDQLKQLSQDLKTSHLHKPTVYFNMEFKPLIHSKWLFVFAFLLLAIEWFLRRYWGSY